MDEAGDGAQRRGLPRAVGAEERDDLPGLDGEVEVAEDGRAVVAGGQAVDLQHGCAHAGPRPRSALAGHGLGRLRGGRAAEVRLDDLGIAAHLVRRA